MDISQFVSGLFSDNLDHLGHRNQVLEGFQLNKKNLLMWGPCRTVRLEDCDDNNERIELGLGFLESMKAGEVLLVEGSHEFAYFGELMTRLSVRQKLAGVVIDGLTRDHIFTQTQDLPIFAKGYSPKDIKLRGRVAEVDCSVKIGHLNIQPGQWIFGDVDGVVAVPEETLDELMKKVESDLSMEEKIKSMISEGATVKEILGVTKSF